MLRQKYVDEFVNLYESRAIILNRDRIDLINWIKRVVLVRDDFYFDEEQIENCITFIEKYYFKLEIWQKFIITFVFLMDKSIDDVVFDEHFWTMARGAGKNGLISGLGNYFISHLHGVESYDVSITATNLSQAITSFKEVHKTIKKKHPELIEDGYFKATEEEIVGMDTDSHLSYRSGTGKGKDSFRDGCLIFDEVHESEPSDDDKYENQTSGMGKVQYGRTFYISTNGFIREGKYDELLDRSRKILESDVLEDTMFPWLCTLDSPGEVEDYSMWQKANPMFHPPMSPYAARLFNTVKKQWLRIKSGVGNKAKWLTKRMNILGVKLSNSVASKAELEAATRDFGKLNDLPAIGSVDLSSVKDFTAMGLLFKRGDEYIWNSHTYVLKKFLETEAIPAPIDEWESDGLLTKIDGDLISEKMVLDWFLEQRELYYFNTIVIDNYRESTLKPILEEAGFHVEVIRRSPGVQAKIGTLIESLFAKKLIVFGKPNMMRWYTFNVLVKRDKDGNMRFEKKEEIKRKTDGFMAFIHALYVSLSVFETEVTSTFEYDDTWIF